MGELIDDGVPAAGSPDLQFAVSDVVSQALPS